MLAPVCLGSTWQTSSSGDNVRLTLANFGLGSSSLWKTKANTQAGTVRLWATAGMGSSSAITRWISCMGQLRAYQQLSICWSIGS
jgi:hypothetical protein